MSFGSPEKTSRWVENQSYAFEVWTDSDKTLASALGAGDGLLPRRVTVLLDPQGRVVLNYPNVAVGTHAEDVLADARRVVSKKR